jgi:hypothetical protein
MIGIHVASIHGGKALLYSINYIIELLEVEEQKRTKKVWAFFSRKT